MKHMKTLSMERLADCLQTAVLKNAHISQVMTDSMVKGVKDFRKLKLIVKQLAPWILRLRTANNRKDSQRAWYDVSSFFALHADLAININAMIKNKRCRMNAMRLRKAKR